MPETTLEDLKPHTTLRGILPDALVEVVSVQVRGNGPGGPHPPDRTATGMTREGFCALEPVFRYLPQ